jgi:hypothetical protein
MDTPSASTQALEARDALRAHYELLAIASTIGCPECEAPLDYQPLEGDWQTDCEHAHVLSNDDVRAFGA